MMNEEKLLTVARYLEGDMEPQEKQEFEALLQSDQELQGLLAEYKNVHQTLKMKIASSPADEAVKATLLSLNTQYFKNAAEEPPVSAQVVSFRPYLKWMSVAAVLMIGLLVWAPWSASLYQKYAISKEMSVVERGDGDKSNVEKAADFYNAGDFVSAAAILQKEHALSPDNSMVAYYYAISLIETGKTEEGRTVLTKLYAGKSVFKYDAAYYMALSYLKQKNNQETLVWLEKIPRDTPHYDKAQQLSKKLN